MHTLDSDLGLGTDTLGSGRFTLLSKLGDGAFGVVYKARDNELDQVVALKQLHQMDPAAIYSFKREFRSLAEIRHPNLVYLYELFAEDDSWFFTMELLEGYDLPEYLALPDEGRAGTGPAPPISAHAATLPAKPADLPVVATSSDSTEPSHGSEPARGGAGSRSWPDEPAVTEPGSGGGGRTVDPAYIARLRPVMEQICTGVAALHDEGMLHRDLKPSNIRVSASGAVKILDFGLVVDDSSQAHDGGIAGTPLYMSPEQTLVGVDLCPASDWYSVGAVLYETLVGEPLFGDCADLAELLQEKLLYDPLPPSHYVEGVPADLDQLCFKLLRRAPEERPSRDAIFLCLAGSPRGPHRDRGRQPALPRSSRAAVIVGRDAELAALRGAFDAVPIHGEPVWCLLHGLSGIGKTALLEAFGRALEGLPVLLLTGRCFQQESVTYKAWDMIMDVLAQHLRRLPVCDQKRLLPQFAGSLRRIFPVLGRVPAIASPAPEKEHTPAAHEIRRRAVASFRELMARLAEVYRLVIVLEDLHWSDADSVELLGELLRGPDAPPLLLLGSYRSDELETSSALQALLALSTQNPSISAPRMLAVDPLPFEISHSLASRLSQQAEVDPLSADRIARESGGNPMLVKELVNAAATGKRVLDAFDLDEAIRQRVSSLPAEPRQLLEVLALAGGPMKPALAARAAGATEIQRHIGELLATSFVRVRSTEAGVTVEPYHARIQESIVAGMPKERSRVLHRRLAVVLEQAHAVDFEGLARHYFGAGELGKGWHYTRMAADEAMKALAFERAVRLYRRLLDQSAPEGEDLVRLQRALADALSNAGRYDEAVAYFDAVLQHARSASPPGKVGLGLTALRSLSSVGLRLLLRPSQRRPTGAQADALKVRYQLALSLIYVDPLRMFVESLILQSCLCKYDVRQVPGGLEMWCFGSAMMSFSGFSFSLSERLLQRCAADPDAASITEAPDYKLSELVLKLAVGRWPDIAELDLRWIDHHLDSGRFWHISSYLLYYTLLLIGRDRFAEAEQLIAKLRRIADEYNYHNVAGAYARFCTVNLMIRRRRLDGLAQEVDSGLAYHVSIGMAGPQILFYAARARMCAWEGDLPQAMELLEHAAQVESAQAPIPPHYTAMLCLARVEVAQRQLRQALVSSHRIRARRARQVASAALRKALHNADKYAFTRAETFCLAGDHHRLLGVPKVARKWFQRAVDEARRLGSPLDEARGLAGLAELCLEHGAGGGGGGFAAAEAEKLRQQARATFEAHGAGWEIGRLPTW